MHTDSQIAESYLLPSTSRKDFKCGALGQGLWVFIGVHRWPIPFWLSSGRRSNRPRNHPASPAREFKYLWLGFICVYPWLNHSWAILFPRDWVYSEVSREAANR